MSQVEIHNVGEFVRQDPLVSVRIVVQPDLHVWQRDVKEGLIMRRDKRERGRLVRAVCEHDIRDLARGRPQELSHLNERALRGLGQVPSERLEVLRVMDSEVLGLDGSVGQTGIEPVVEELLNAIARMGPARRQNDSNGDGGDATSDGD